MHDVDCVVIGSGFGGAVSALRMAEKGDIQIIACALPVRQREQPVHHAIQFGHTQIVVRQQRTDIRVRKARRPRRFVIPAGQGNRRKTGATRSLGKFAQGAETHRRRAQNRIIRAQSGHCPSPARPRDARREELIARRQSGKA